MPPRLPEIILKSIYYYRRVFLNNPGDPIMRRCGHCIRRDKEYKLGGSSNSYTACVASSLSCELSFSEAKLYYIWKKRTEKLHAQREIMREAVARVARL